MDVDDDNLPAPENNVPPTSQTYNILSNNWGHDGVCFRKEKNYTNAPAKLTHPVDATRDDVNLQLFERLFPKKFMEEVMIPTMNQSMNNPVSYGEFLCWIGLWILMSTVDGSDRRSFWSSKDINMFDGAPFRLTHYMSRNRFEEILSAISYTNKCPPQMLDKFWEIRELIDAWNDNMEEEFLPSWINAIDESMSKWLNEFTCPGFMYVPRKPWPFGNEYQDAGCCLSNILWHVDLREGKDRPRHLGEKEHDNLGRTVGVLLRLTKPIWASGKVVVLDSGFCVLQGLVELLKKGVYAHALIKKRRYWPKHVPGEQIIQHFNDKSIGDADAIHGELDGKFFYLFGMKEPDYVMQIMSMYGTLQKKGPEKKRHYEVDGQKEVKMFFYPEVVHNHYAYRDMIDNHNSQRMHPISIEETWMTTRWPNRVFGFLLAITVVNVQNAGVYFCGMPKIDAIRARKLIGQQLIQNRYILEENERPKKQPRRGTRHHHLITLPTFKKFEQGRLVKCKSKYQTWKCSCRAARVRTFCICTPGVLYCSECYAEHISEAVVNDLIET